MDDTQKISNHIAESQKLIVDSLNEITAYLDDDLKAPKANATFNEVLSVYGEAVNRKNELNCKLARLYRLKVGVRHLRVVMSNSQVIPALIGKFKAQIEAMTTDVTDAIKSIEFLMDKYNNIIWYCSCANKSYNNMMMGEK